MKRYKVKLKNDPEGLVMVANMSEASAPICWVDDDGEVRSSPFQTADARHFSVRAAKLLIEWFRAQGGDEDEVLSAVELEGGEVCGT
jgi:hypothetical protein